MEVRRESLVLDGLSQVNKLRQRFRGYVRVGFVDKFGGPVDDRFPDFEWEETVRRGMNYDYEIDIIDEFGGKTQMPTTSPTPKPTAHYLPSTLLSDPFRGLYTTYFLISFIAFFVAVSVFIAGRWFYNWKEERDVGAWFM